MSVTPFVGVWIETIPSYCCLLMILSHPSWVCGLKLGKPRTMRFEGRSHPSWVCGLKLVLLANLVAAILSHPSWVCGLKQVKKNTLMLFVLVTPFVGVWIETDTQTINDVSDESHPSWVCGLKRIRELSISSRTPSHPSWVCGLKPTLCLTSRRAVQVTPFVGVWIET